MMVALTSFTFCAAVLIFSFVGPAHAQFANNVTTDGACSCPDVLLNVTSLGVDNITLNVNQVEAHLNLDTKIGNFVTLTAGVDASIQNVQLVILGVHARADLTVRLDNVYKIVSRALDTIDRNPQILTSLIQAVTNLLQTTVDTLGNLVQTVVSQTGEIIQRTLNQAGTLLSTQVIGSVTDLPQVGNYTNTAGQLVKIFQDTTTSNLIEVTFNAVGGIVGTHVLSS